jgi:hypothetical protein
MTNPSMFYLRLFLTLQLGADWHGHPVGRRTRQSAVSSLAAQQTPAQQPTKYCLCSTTLLNCIAQIYLFNQPKIICVIAVATALGHLIKVSSSVIKHRVGSFRAEEEGTGSRCGFGQQDQEEVWGV